MREQRNKRTQRKQSLFFQEKKVRHDESNHANNEPKNAKQSKHREGDDYLSYHRLAEREAGAYNQGKQRQGHLNNVNK